MQRDIFESLSLRDEGIDLVLNHQGAEWKETAKQLVLMYLKSRGPDLIESARAFCVNDCGLTDPTSPNAWGAIAMALSKAGSIERTGEWRNCAAVKSHARMQPVWRAR